MYYTKMMQQVLKSLEPEAEILFRHYLDQYYYTYKEPLFASLELKTIWLLLIVESLCAEILYKGPNYAIAKKQLRRLMIINSRWYANRTSDRLTDTVPITIGEVKMYNGKKTRGYIQKEALNMIKEGTW